MENRGYSEQKFNKDYSSLNEADLAEFQRKFKEKCEPFLGAHKSSEFTGKLIEMAKKIDENISAVIHSGSFNGNYDGVNFENSEGQAGARYHVLNGKAMLENMLDSIFSNMAIPNDSNSELYAHVPVEILNRANNEFLQPAIKLAMDFLGRK